MDQLQKKPYPIKKALVFFAIVIVWIILDQMTKSLFAGQTPGGVLAGPFLGLIDIRLVHNTGGAWGIFSGSTFALGLFSVAVCAVITIFILATARGTDTVQFVAAAFIVAGGLGNAIDRFAQGFVVDFIEFSFFDFPVFNVADIGVTCGFAVLVLSMLFTLRTENH